MALSVLILTEHAVGRTLTQVVSADLAVSDLAAADLAAADLAATPAAAGHGAGTGPSGSFPLGESLRAHGCVVRLWKPGFPTDVLESDQTDVVLVRSNDADVLDAAAALEARGLPVVNPVAAARDAADKWVTYLRLTEAGLETPDTTDDVDTARAGSLGVRVVAKPRIGSRGRGVTALDSADITADVTASITLDGTTEPTVYQRFVEHDFDWRLVVVDGAVVLARRRVPQQGEFRTNVSLGATVIDGDWPDEHTLAAAVAAAEALGCSFCGVDVIPTPQGPVVLEVNAALALRNMTPEVLEQVTTPLVALLDRLADQVRASGIQ